MPANGARENRGKRAAEAELDSGEGAVPVTGLAATTSTGKSAKRSRGADSPASGKPAPVQGGRAASRAVLNPSVVLAHIHTLTSTGQHYEAYSYFLEHLSLFSDPMEMEYHLNRLLRNSRQHFLSLSPQLGTQARLSGPLYAHFECGHLLVEQVPPPAQIPAPQSKIFDPSVSSPRAGRALLPAESSNKMDLTDVEEELSSKSEEAHRSSKPAKAPRSAPQKVTIVSKPRKARSSPLPLPPSIEQRPSPQQSSERSNPQGSPSTSGTSSTASAPSTPPSALYEVSPSPAPPPHPSSLPPFDSPLSTSGPLVQTSPYASSDQVVPMDASGDLPGPFSFAAAFADSSVPSYAAPPSSLLMHTTNPVYPSPHNQSTHGPHHEYFRPYNQTALPSLCPPHGAAVPLAQPSTSFFPDIDPFSPFNMIDYPSYEWAAEDDIGQ